MGIKNLFSRKEEDEDKDKDRKSKDDGPAETDSELKVLGLPKDNCNTCNKPFKSEDEAYQCSKCETFFHHPGCVEELSNCPKCGTRINRRKKPVIVIKLKHAVCPKCKHKIDINFSREPTVQLRCTNCKSRGRIPNPYLEDDDKDTKKDKKEKEKDKDKEEEEEEKQEEEKEEEEELPQPTPDFDDDTDGAGLYPGCTALMEFLTTSANYNG